MVLCELLYNPFDIYVARDEDVMGVFRGVLSDVIGIVKSADDIRAITSKAGKELKKRDVNIVDESQVQIRLTLWANDVS